MSQLSDWSENALLDWLMGGASPTRPTARYLALFTAAPSDSGGGNATFNSVPAGSVLSIRVSKVLSTGTTATNIVALS